MIKKLNKSKGISKWLCLYIKSDSRIGFTMLNREIRNSIVKYLSNEATSEDLNLLSDWILQDDNDRIFEEFVKLHYEIMTAMNKPDVDKIKINLLREIKKGAAKDRHKLYKHRVTTVLKYAAVGLLFFVLGDLHQNGYFETAQTDLIPIEEVITIEMGNGRVETIDPQGTKVVRNSEGKVIGTQKESHLTYKSTAQIDKLVFNTIRIPYGKRFDIVLSDGTHVFLNSGSSLKYPVKFLNGLNRIVHLTGEAYFEVAKDKEHPFIVNADDIEVKVLGTKFNVSYYSEDKSIETVLVEGSVELQDKEKSSGDHATLLEPGYMAAWNKVEKTMTVENVDTRLYTAWTQGKLVFRNTTFRKIRQALERKYNVTIINHNLDLDDQLFDATFDIENIEQVLKSFNKSYAIDYKIIDNKVIID